MKREAKRLAPKPPVSGLSCSPRAGALGRLSIFASGRGTNLENILRHIKMGRIHAEAVLALSDNPEAPALVKARRFRVPTLCLDPKAYPSKDAFEEDVLKALRARQVDLIALAGYMRILGPILIRAFPGRILNIHPALLPAFKGTHAIRDAYEYGVKVTGVTVHFVDEQVDHGPILLQKEVRIQPQDTLRDLERRIHRVEYELYPMAIERVLSGRVRVRSRKVTKR